MTTQWDQFIKKEKNIRHTTWKCICANNTIATKYIVQGVSCYLCNIWGSTLEEGITNGKKNVCFCFGDTENML